MSLSSQTISNARSRYHISAGSKISWLVSANSLQYNVEVEEVELHIVVIYKPSTTIRNIT